MASEIDACVGVAPLSGASGTRARCWLRRGESPASPSTVGVATHDSNIELGQPGRATSIHNPGYAYKYATYLYTYIYPE